MITLSTVNLPIQWPGGIQLDPSAGITVMVVRMKMDPSSSNVGTDESPIFMKFGILVRTASRVRFIRQRKLTSALDLLVNL